MKYKISEPKTYSVRDARANFSKIINTVVKTNVPVAVKNKDAIKIAIISYKDAQKYIPEKKLKKTIKPKTFYEAYLEFQKKMEKWHKKHPVKYDKSLETLSSDVNKILYGQ